ncbi:Zinc finger, RanBP2-type [Sesbania bispinosa]|nr:Zinc finger, RanBP2-type [Sesbania bispinosa]
MGTGALEMNRKTSREAENSLHKQADQAPSEGFIGRGENLLSDGNDAVADHTEELSHSHPDAPKRARLQKELTFQDMYQNEGMFDDEDEDDSDWEPFQLHKCVEVAKWFCKNCTMVNLDNVVHCNICREHKDSKILSCGFFASPFAQDEDLPEVQPNTKGLKGTINDIGFRKESCQTVLSKLDKWLPLWLFM